MFTEIEKTIKKLSPNSIRFLGLRKSTLPKTLDEFIVKLFKDYNNKFNTVYIKSRISQESKGKRRSFSDIYNLCKYYYPEATVEDVMKGLVKIMGRETGFRSSPCNMMKRRAYYYDSKRSAAIFDSSWYKDEFGHYYQTYEDHFK